MFGEQTSAHVSQIFWFILKHFGKQIPHFLSVSSSEHTLVHVQPRIQRKTALLVLEKNQTEMHFSTKYLETLARPLKNNF